MTSYQIAGSFWDLETYPRKVPRVSLWEGQSPREGGAGKDNMAHISGIWPVHRWDRGGQWVGMLRLVVSLRLEKRERVGVFRSPSTDLVFLPLPFLLSFSPFRIHIRWRELQELGVFPGGHKDSINTIFEKCLIKIYVKEKWEPGDTGNCQPRPQGGFAEEGSRAPGLGQRSRLSNAKKGHVGTASAWSLWKINTFFIPPSLWLQNWTFALFLPLTLESLVVRAKEKNLGDL